MPNDPGRNSDRAWFNEPDRESLPSSRSSDGGLFGWTVLIIVLIGFAISCWVGSYYIFGHPEKPFSHEVLTRLKKIDPPKRFELTAAPRGEFLRAPQIFDRFSSMKPRQLGRTNEIFLRNYIRNFKPVDGLVPYVVGTFNILDSYELTSSDFFVSGVVVLAQSKENPNLLIEQIFTSNKKSIPNLHRSLLTGLDIDLKRENELAAIINVERLKDGRVKISTISILYPSYESAQENGTFSLDPPDRLNVKAGLPLIDKGRQNEAEVKYAHFRRKSKPGVKEKEMPKPVAELASANQRLMRVEKPLPADEATPTPTPSPVATPLPIAAPTPLPVATTTPTPVVSPTPLLAKATPTPVTRKAIPARPTPTPSPVATPPPAMIATTPAPTPTPTQAIAASNSKEWTVYEPGRMPRGRLLTSSDVSEVAAKGSSGERIYLQGNFNVTASGGDRAVLRPSQRSSGLGSRTDGVRIIVQYPNGMKAPSDGSFVSRDSRRPFQVMDVRESTGGQINVYVREVTKP
jgi:hypothetical protein